MRKQAREIRTTDAHGRLLPGLAVAVVAVAAGAAVRLLFMDSLGNRAPYLTFYPAVILAALIGGLPAGLLATALSSLLAIYFWIEPVGFGISHPADWLAMSVFIVSCVITTVVTEAMHRARARAQAAEAELQLAAERGKAEKALKQSEERLNKAQEIAQIGSWELDLVNNRLSWSDEVYRIFGLRPQEFGASYEAFLDAVHPEDRAKVDDAYAGSLKEGTAGYEITHRVVRKATGEVRFVHEKCQHFRDESGRIIRSVGMVHDITERKQAEDALKKSEEALRRHRDSLEGLVRERTARLEALNKDISMQIQAMPIGHIVWDADVKVSSWNPAAEKIFGYAASEALGKPPSFFAPEEARPYVDRISSRLLEGDETAHSLNTNLTKDGRAIICEWHNTPLKDESGNVTGILSMVNDVTEMKRAEDEALRTQKLDSLRVLAGGIAHDLNNMMVAIEANAGLALRAIESGLPAREYLAGIENAADKVSSFSKQILSFTGKYEEAKEPVALNDVIMDTARLLMASISEKAELKYELADGLPHILAHPQNIQQVVMNLIINASDALGDDRGTIKVSSGIVSAGRQYLDTLHPAGLPEGEYAFVEVSDTGCGMGPETRRRLFDPFYTTKFTGRGLGLSAVFGIASGHGGGIGFTSEVGCGATFRVLLPVPATPLEPVPAKPVYKEAWDGKGTILVVDDNEDSLIIARTVLETAGYKVLTAQDGTEAVDVYRTHSASVSAVIMDLIMPRMRGDEAARELRKIRGDSHILFLSGYHELKLDDLMEGAGRTAVLEKPYRVQSLLGAVRDILKPA